jgi:glyoxylase-like metal-dependent hydrolase (beta-lactamase superfamily II)
MHEENPSDGASLPSRVLPITEASFALDGGAMFGIIPRPLWGRTNPPDEKNRIDLACRCLLVEYPDGTRALVDVGIGTSWSDREREIYKISDQDPRLDTALAEQSIAPDSIDEVILTHLHFDHAGGVSYLDDAGERRASFPRARHWVQRRNWSWAHAPSSRDAGSYRREDFSFFETRDDAPELVLVDGIDEILPGIEVLPVHGHTFGMQVVKITTERHIFAFLADLIPTTSHMRDPYVMGYDLQPLVTVEEKRELLHRAEREGWILVFEHDPETAMARVEFDERERPRAVAVEPEELA